MRQRVLLDSNTSWHLCCEGSFSELSWESLPDPEMFICINTHPATTQSALHSPKNLMPLVFIQSLLCRSVEMGDRLDEAEEIAEVHYTIGAQNRYMGIRVSLVCYL